MAENPTITNSILYTKDLRNTLVDIDIKLDRILGRLVGHDKSDMSEVAAKGAERGGELQELNQLIDQNYAIATAINNKVHNLERVLLNDEVDVSSEESPDEETMEYVQRPRVSPVTSKSSRRR